MGYCARCKKSVLVTQKWIKKVGTFYHFDCYNRLVRRNKRIIITSSAICGVSFVALVSVVLSLTL